MKDHPAICLVDPAIMHNKDKDTDFADFQTHLSNKRIPKNEIWINSKLKREDHHVAIAVGTQEYKDMLAGVSLDKSLDSQRKLEIKIRRKDKDHDLAIEPYPDGKEYDPEIKSIGNIPSFLVNGEAVRNLYSVGDDNPFEQGGHDLRYPYIKAWAKKEGYPGAHWVDKSDLEPVDYAPTLRHETGERNDMGKGMKYEPAHVKATSDEKKFRSRS